MIPASRSSVVYVVLLCAAAVLHAPAQRPPASAPAYAFDVVSIKLHAPGDNSRHIFTDNGRFSANNISLRGLIVSAYGVGMEDLVSGIPRPLDEQRFDVEAKTDEDTSAALKKLSHDELRKQQQGMFRAMLEERFQLKAHVESKEQPVYALVIAKGGFKLKPADPNDTYPNGIKGPDGTSHAGMSTLRSGDWKAQGVPIKSMLGTLQGQMDVRRIVIDRTGLTGSYDFDLRWNAANTLGSSDNGSTDQGPSLLVAIEEQLGLKLEPTKAPVDSVVVDHVTAPSEN